LNGVGLPKGLPQRADALPAVLISPDDAAGRQLLVTLAETNLPPPATDGGSLPYALAVNANDRDASSIRMGAQVPVLISPLAKDGTPLPNTGPPQYQPRNVGTNIDCFARTMEDGRFQVNSGSRTRGSTRTSRAPSPPAWPADQ
jgi:hypothetical protein